MRIYEINARARFRRFAQLTDSELLEIARLGFDAIWLMGVWQISEAARRISKVISDDFEGSPYAIPDYRFNPDLGGKAGFVALVNRAHEAGLRVIVDFVSNHMAIDSPWIGKHPDFFIRNNPAVRDRGTGDYFLHKSGELVAFGRDPYFPPWHDTSQLDYTSPALRSHMIDVLKWISLHADGVRCDMAMLVLRDYIRQFWYPRASESWFSERMPGEFWKEAIDAVKGSRPDFIFIAEAYWDKEEYLLSLGFDLAYEKKLYDGLVSGNIHLIKERLSRSPESVRASLCFTENHDEARAASVFSRGGNLAAAALILSLPSSTLIHEGQMEGKREKLPVQRLSPLHDEPADPILKIAYTYLLQATSDEVFREGSHVPFDSGPGIVSFMRQKSGRAVAYFGQVSNQWEKFNTINLDISPVARALGAHNRMRVSNLLTSTSFILEPSGGRFVLNPGQLSVDDDTRFCLLEASLVD
ncbi:MAG TPA: alpha-amylase family glycosyl hydrolase [Blastocatellia bacterium]|nr:alpha-amylase family glycosyl hydrolase [Blastocatellia bacterium]